jgi:hypothetical protein
MCLNRGMAPPERGAPFTPVGFACIERLGKIAEIVVRGTSPFAQARLWIRACQSVPRHEGAAYLGHKNIQHTVRYTELSLTRFKNFWRE